MSDHDDSAHQKGTHDISGANSPVSGSLTGSEDGKPDTTEVAAIQAKVARLQAKRSEKCRRMTEEVENIEKQIKRINRGLSHLLYMKMREQMSEAEIMQPYLDAIEANRKAEQHPEGDRENDNGPGNQQKK